MQLSLLAFISLVCSAFVAFALHELAHAIAGHFAGLQIREISIGAAPVLLRFKMGDTDVRLGLSPTSGLVTIYPPLRPSRYRRLIFVAAGPLMDIAWLAILLGLLLFLYHLEIANAVLMPALVVQCCMLIFSLYPRWIHLGGQTLRSDALHLWHLVHEREDAYARHSASYEIVLETYRSYPETPFVPSRQSERIAFHLFPGLDDHPNKTKRSQETSAAIAYRQELKRQPSREEELLMIDSIVTEALRQPVRGMEEELDILSARAFATAPDIRTLRGSRGAVLARAGRHSEALALLDLRDDDMESYRGLTLGFRSLALFHAGEIEKARAELDQAILTMRTIGSPSWIGNDILMSIGSMIRYWPKCFDAPQHRDDAQGTSA